MCTNFNEIFYYKEGWLYWKISPSYRIKEHTIAGNKNGAGYWQVCYKGKFYQLHNIVWILHNGDIPEGFRADHFDRNKDNNSIENFRLVTNSDNSFNRGVQSNNKLGIKGVSKHNNRFVAYIRLNKKTLNLGYYDTAEEASVAYNRALDAVSTTYKVNTNV